MGYANVENISRFINRELKKAPASLSVLVKKLVEQGEKLQASEGAHAGESEIWLGAYGVLDNLYGLGDIGARTTTKAQELAFQTWKMGDPGFWENEEMQKAFDSILWYADSKKLSVIRHLVA